MGISPKYYKGYRIGSFERAILQFILNIKNKELPLNNDSFLEIIKTARQKSEFSSVIKRLKEKKLIGYSKEAEELKISLTPKGKIIAKEFFLNNINYDKPPKWDGLWNVVIFDVPQSKKKIRDLVRYHLKRIGFIQLQGSVWVYPYSCDEIVLIIKTYLDLGQEVIYMRVKEIEGDKRLRKHFKL